MYRFFSNTYIWGTIALIALMLCIDIEYQWVLLPCKSLEIAQATNKVVLALSYSYIAGAIFHFIVNYCPHKMRQQIIRPFLEHNMWQLIETIRQCYIVVLPPFDIRGEGYNRREYVEKFSSVDLFEDSVFNKGKSKLERLNSLRMDINELITRLLTYREYLNENQFSFINEVVTSNFMTNSIVPNSEVCNDLYKNQDLIGGVIFDIYEKTKQFNKK